MKWLIVLLLIISVETRGSDIRAIEERPTILVTSYEPWGDIKTNLSKNVALALPRYVDNEIRIEHCFIPVEFYGATDAVLKCLDKMDVQPDFVLSLGIGPCDLQLITSAQNLIVDDVVEKENDGTSKVLGFKLTKVSPYGAEKLSFTAPIEEFYCALDSEERQHVEVAPTAGEFVCNTTAYTLLKPLAARGIPHAFIHVPGEACLDPKNMTAEQIARAQPEYNAALIGQMLMRVDFSKYAEPQPLTLKEVGKKLKTIKYKKSCTYEFYQRLQKVQTEKEKMLQIIKNQEYKPTAKKN